MKHDPLTLFVALDADGESQGTVYLDDELSTQYKDGAFDLRALNYGRGSLTCRSVAGSGYNAPNTVERVCIVGLNDPPSAVTLKLSQVSVTLSVLTARCTTVVPVQGDTQLVYWHDASSKTLTIKKPDVKITEDWEIVLTF
jgi:alpha 1,3-glucosidase